VVTYSRGFASARLGDVIDGGASSVLEYVTEYPAAPLVGFGLVLGTLALRDEHTRAPARVALLAAGGGWLAARLPGESYVHYFLLTVPGLAVLCGLGVDSLASRSSISRAALAAVVVVPIGFALGLTPIRDALLIAPEQRWGTTALPCLDAQRRAAEAIRGLTDPEDRIYVSTGDSLNYYGQQIYWQARRLPASRYIFPRDVEPPAYAQVAEDLRRSPPVAIALMPGGEHAEVGAAIRDQDLRPVAAIGCEDGTAIEVLA
jgi:hypothetical protein